MSKAFNHAQVTSQFATDTEVLAVINKWKIIIY